MLSSTDQARLVLAGTVPVAAAAEDAPLTCADRCDRCCAQAKVRVRFTAGDLLFCGHHSKQHAAAIWTALH